MTGVSDLCTMISPVPPLSLFSMPAHARVWVYKSVAAFSAMQRKLIAERGAAFVDSWAVHGAPLTATADVLYDHFVVLAVDERQAAASGCSIDGSVRLVQELERELGLSLTDRMVVLFERDGIIHGCRVPDIVHLLRSGELAPDTLVFDDLVATKGDLDARFRVPLRETWMARYL
jgi:hypothetical protein